jgi:hypothetical protein
MNERIHTPIRSIVLSLVSVCISFILIEFGFRIYGSVKDIDFRLYSKELKNSDRLPDGLFDDGLRAGARVLATTSDFTVEYSINSKRLRDKEYAYEKLPGTPRIGVFGDSFTFGEGVAYGKRFTDIAESDLPGVEVLNFGVPGVGLDDIALSVFHEGFRFDPDYIVIMINRYVIRRGNPDITAIMEYTATGSATLTDAGGNTPNTTLWRRNDPFFTYQPNILLRNSYALSYFHYQYSLRKVRQRMEEYDRALWNRFKACDRASTCDTMDRSELKNRTIQLLDKLSAVSREKGSTLVVVNIDTEPLEFFYDDIPPFAYYDLHKELVNESRIYPLTFTYDHHYNEKTNDFLGRKLTGIFKELISR